MYVSLCKNKLNLFQDWKSLPETARKKKIKVWKKHSLLYLIDTHHPMGKEAHTYTRRKGSYTLEAAVILPIVAGFFVSILFFFRVLQVQTQVQEALYYAGRKTACEAGSVDSPSVLLASANAYFQKELNQYDEVKAYVKGGNWGISLLRSGISGEYVELQADYYIRLPVRFFPVKGILVTQHSKNRKWTGDRNDDVLEDYVYVTRTGAAYHRSRTCSYLDLSIRAADFADLAGMRNKNEHKYYACSECVVKNSKLTIVYITDYGTCYHANLACSGLKRTVSIIPVSETGDRHPCAKCSGKQ